MPSKIHKTATVRDDLLQQKAELEAQILQHSRDQNDVCEYLTSKLEGKYMAIAELEMKVRALAHAAISTTLARDLACRTPSTFLSGFQGHFPKHGGEIARRCRVNLMLRSWALRCHRTAANRKPFVRATAPHACPYRVRLTLLERSQ